MVSRLAAEEAHLLEAVETVELGLEQVDDAVEDSGIGGEIHTRHVGLRRSEKRDVMTQFLADAHVVRDGMRIPRIVAVLHHEKDVHCVPPARPGFPGPIMAARS